MPSHYMVARHNIEKLSKPRKINVRYHVKLCSGIALVLEPRKLYGVPLNFTGTFNILLYRDRFLFSYHAYFFYLL